MARRATKAESQLLFWMILIGLPAYGFYLLGSSMGWGVFLGLIAAVSAVIIWFVAENEKKRKAEQQRKLEARKAELFAKYGDAQIVATIMNHEIWQGQTADQLSDSLGQPVDIDEKVFKTKRKETWKYHQTGSNRFALRITLEDGVVVGWDDKR